MEEHIIQIPDTLEVKEIKDGKIILVEKEKKLTYKDIARKLFRDGEKHYFITADGEIDTANNHNINRYCKNNANSKKQLEKLLAINMLMNVAKDLNCNWQHDWSDEEEPKYYIYINNVTNNLCTECTGLFNGYIIYFKSKEFANKAIKILGEETIKLALCTDY